MQFTKMNGAGNDFIILDNLDSMIPHSRFPEIARILCRRHLSVGADGLMVVEPARQGGSFRMLFFNADGSAGEMCGNGARCICRYGYEHGLAGEVQTIETPSGVVTGWRIDRRNYRIRLTDPSVVRLDCPVTAGGRDWPCAYVELGEPGLPHAVVPYPGLAERTMDQMRELGRELRWSKVFPKGANVDFYDLTSPDHVTLLTFERGVEDFTYACGTGTGSTALALTLMGLVSGENVAVANRGGTMYVTIDRNGSDIQNIWLTGPTNLVYEGNAMDDELGDLQ